MECSLDLIEEVLELKMALYMRVSFDRSVGFDEMLSIKFEVIENLEAMLCFSKGLVGVV